MGPAQERHHLLRPSIDALGPSLSPQASISILDLVENGRQKQASPCFRPPLLTQPRAQEERRLLRQEKGSQVLKTWQK